MASFVTQPAKQFLGGFSPGAAYGACGSANGAYGIYGIAGAQQANLPASGVRPTVRRMNLVGVAFATFVPWVIFCFLTAALSFEMHFRQPSTVQALVIATASVLVVVLVGDLWWICQKRQMGVAGMNGASWVLFMCFTGLVAVALAVVFGNRVFELNSEPFFDITALNSYDEVDPGSVRGQELMDAGQILFSKNAHLDLTKSMSFKNQNTYCVTPITVSNGDIWNPPLPSYDFWAVGKDCCSPTANSFHCGAWDNPKARGGLRMVQDDERAFYRLAVQQAQSAYAIKAVHPLFFHWVAEPVVETYRLQQNAYKAFLLAMGCYLACQIMLVCLASMCFYKLRQH